MGSARVSRWAAVKISQDGRSERVSRVGPAGGRGHLLPVEVALVLTRALRGPKGMSTDRRRASCATEMRAEMAAAPSPTAAAPAILKSLNRRLSGAREGGGVVGWHFGKPRYILVFRGVCAVRCSLSCANATRGELSCGSQWFDSPALLGLLEKGHGGKIFFDSKYGLKLSSSGFAENFICTCSLKESANCQTPPGSLSASVPRSYRTTFESKKQRSKARRN